MSDSSEKKPLPFTFTEGGPVIVMSAEVCAQWGAREGEGEYCGHLDYDLACEAQDLIFTASGGLGWNEFAGTIALILELDVGTVFVKQSETVGILCRAGDDVTEDDARELIAQSKKADWSALEKLLTLASGKFFTFDATGPGASAIEDFDEYTPAIEGQLQPGSYKAEITTVDGSDLIRLSLQST